MNKNEVAGSGGPHPSRTRDWVRFTTVLAASVVAVALFGCRSFGPVGVDSPNRSFAGLNAIVQDLPEGGTLDIF